ncbi:unnamed protein product [Debaryomyces tyrocola]|nr:unnamed protein product [Debaryomyces tyrocola]
MKLPNVAVVGGGPAGLMLGRLLLLKKIPFTIFELDSGPDERNQGGTLDLHPETGQVAIKKAQLVKEFQLRARPEGDCMKLVSYNGTILFDERQNNKSFENSTRPEIDRNKLKNMLLESFDQKHINWSKKLRNIDVVGDKYNLNFSDGTAEAGYDVVVGADGAWSKVRPLVTEVKPYYSSVTLIEFWRNNATKTSPWLSDYVGQGSCSMYDENRAVMGQRNGDDSIRIYACMRKDELWSKTCGIDWSNKTNARRELIKLCFDDCHEDIKSMILEGTDELIVRPLYMLPIGISWLNRKGITLVGDAAHLMTPFAANGANLALFDAWKLVESIEESKGDYLQGIVRYEQSLFERSKEHAKETWDNLETFFKADGNEKIIKLIQGH